MERYARSNAAFSLCGLNCCLCPRYHTDGPSQCPGCGGTDFHLKHPTCAVISCSKKHGSIEYCFECAEYPCKKYAGPNTADSFISYRNVTDDLAKAKNDMDEYMSVLNRKHEILKLLLERFNDGRSKGFYCLAVNLLPIETLETVLNETGELSWEERPGMSDAKKMVESLKIEAQKLKIELTLRK